MRSCPWQDPSQEEPTARLHTHILVDSQPSRSSQQISRLETTRCWLYQTWARPWGRLRRGVRRATRVRRNARRSPLFSLNRHCSRFCALGHSWPKTGRLDLQGLRARAKHHCSRRWRSWPKTRMRWRCRQRQQRVRKQQTFSLCFKGF